MTAVLTVSAAHADSITESVRQRTAWLPRAVAPQYANPALKGLQYSLSITELAVRTQADRYVVGTVQASTYRHLGAGTVWGDAAFRFGKVDHRAGMVSSVTPDLIPMPYMPATDRADAFTTEQYEFSGGYSGGNAWRYGATLAYKALMSYRTADPRPKNVSGTLRLTVGAARLISARRYIAVCGEYTRYTQTSSLMFVSGQGAEPVYHLTGLGSRYRRFDGQGWRSHYSGNSASVQVSSLPAGHGWIASASGSYGRLSTRLTDLNNLPLANITNAALAVSGGYSGGAWYAALQGSYCHSTGTENIFGDAAAGVYPVIGSQQPYAARQATLTALGVKQLGALTLRTETSYNSATEHYYTDHRLLRTTAVTASVGVQWQRYVGHCLLSAEGSAHCYCPLDGELCLPDPVDALDVRLAAEVKYDYRYARRYHLGYSAQAWTLIPLRRLALMAGVAAVHQRHNTYNIFISIAF